MSSAASSTVRNQHADFNFRLSHTWLHNRRTKLPPNRNLATSDDDTIRRYEVPQIPARSASECILDERPKEMHLLALRAGIPQQETQANSPRIKRKLALPKFSVTKCRLPIPGHPQFPEAIPHPGSETPDIRASFGTTYAAAWQIAVSEFATFQQLPAKSVRPPDGRELPYSPILAERNVPTPEVIPATAELPPQALPQTSRQHGD